MHVNLFKYAFELVFVLSCVCMTVYDSLSLHVN